MHISAFKRAAIAFPLLTSCLVDASPPYMKRNDSSLYHETASGGSGAITVTSNTTGCQTTSTLSQPSSTATSSQGPNEHFNPSQPPLAPAVHPNQPTDKVESLAPVNQQFLYYSSNATSGSSSTHVFAEISFNATYPCVVLLHSQYVQSIAFRNGAIDINMSDIQALAYVESTWPSSSPIIVAALVESQGQPAQQHTFWMANGVKVDHSDGCVHVNVQQELSIEEAMPEVEIVWGTYQPTNNSTSSSDGPGAANGPITSGSGTFNATSAACGLSPSSLIDGFHTATCGSPTFDSDIDREIGYLDFNAQNWSTSLANFAPGLNGSDYSVGDNQDFGPVEPGKRVRLRRRGFFSSIVDGISSVGNAVANAGQAVVQGAVNVAGQVTSAVSDALAVTPSANADIPINIGPSGLVSSPFGAAKQLFAKDAISKNGATGHVAVYCVQCGVHGDLRLTGQARYTIKNGLEQASAALNGNIAAGLQIGIDATAEISQNSQFPLISTAVPPGFSVPGVFSIGPMVTLEADLQLDISLAGQVLAGVTMTIPNFSANLDLVNSAQSSSSGFTPQFQNVFQANAAITATAGLGLPLGVGLGISIPPLKFQKTAALYDKPSVGATITYTGSTTNGGNGGDENCVNGISYSLTLGNDVYADIFGLAQVNILQFSQPVAASCVSLGGSSEKRSVSRRTQSSRFRSSKRDAQGADPWAYIDSDKSNLAADNPGFQNLSDQALKQANSESAPTNQQSGFVDDPGISWVYINDQSRKWSLTADPVTGNVYVADPGQGSLFATKDGFMIGDVSGSCFHYYPDLMERYGVSRLRFANQTTIPKDANYVGFMSVSIGEKDGANSTTTSRDVYAAFDTKKNTFLLATCNIKGQNSKIFLARDAETGVKVLQEEKLRWTVTGGIVENCFYQLWDAAPLQAQS